MKGHRILNSGSKKGIIEMGTQRTVDRAAATQLIIDLPTHTQAKGPAASSEGIHTNLRAIETGSQVVHNGLLTYPLAENTTGHGLHLRIDPARPPPNTAYRHVQTSPRMTHEGRPGIGVGTIILVTNLAIDTTVQTTRRHIVTTVPKVIHGGRHMITGLGLLLPLCLDPPEWIMLHLLLALMTHHMASTPLRRHPQTRLPHPLQNDPYLQNINRYPSLFLRRSQLLRSSAGPLHRLILFSPPKLSQRLNQAPPINLPHHHRNGWIGRDVLARKRSWLTTARSQDVAQFRIMTLRPNWGKEHLGKSCTPTRHFPLTTFAARYIRQSRKPQERSSP